MATKIVEEMTSQEELFNHLYEACNILRGPINQDEFKSYVTPILFFKRISTSFFAHGKTFSLVRFAKTNALDFPFESFIFSFFFNPEKPPFLG